MFKFLKNLIFLACAAGIAFYVWQFINAERRLTALENEAHRLFEEGKTEEALEKYLRVDRELADRPQLLAGQDRVQNLRWHIARCYVRLAEDPRRPLVESLELYRQAREFHENAIEDKNILRLLDAK